MVLDPVQGKLASLGACGDPEQDLRAVDGGRYGTGMGLPRFGGRVAS